MSIVPLHSESIKETAVGIALGDTVGTAVRIALGTVDGAAVDGTAVGIALGTVDGAAVTTKGQKLCVNQ